MKSFSIPQHISLPADTISAALPFSGITECLLPTDTHRGRASINFLGNHIMKVNFCPVQNKISCKILILHEISGGYLA